MNDVSIVAGGLGVLLGLLAVGITIFEKVRPKTPCAIGDQRWDTQQEKNREFDRRLDSGNRAFEHVRDEIRSGLSEVSGKFDVGMKEVVRDLRVEMRRIEDNSTAGDKGLQELSKNLVNAVTEMKEMTKAITDGKRGQS